MEKAESTTNENLLKSDDSDIKVIDHTIFHILMRIIQLILLLLGLICVCFVIGKYCFLVSSISNTRIENEKIIQKINKIKNESVYLNSLLNSEIQKQNELKKKVNILITNIYIIHLFNAINNNYYFIADP